MGAETHTYDFDSLDRLVAFDGVNYTYDGLGRVASRGADTFTYTGFSLDPTSDGEYVYGRSPGGSLLSVSDGSETVLVGRDRHGDVTHLFDASGSVEFSSLYDPFGDVTTTAGTRVGSVGFQGDWTDPDSEHVWMGARWYDGGWATFLSRDTVFGELSTSVSLNRYTYAHNNPLSYWDPDGRCPDYLKSVNGGAAWEQCRGFQDEMGRQGIARLKAEKSSLGHGAMDVISRLNGLGALRSTNRTPEAASERWASFSPAYLEYLEGALAQWQAVPEGWDEASPNVQSRAAAWAFLKNTGQISLDDDEFFELADWEWVKLWRSKGPAAMGSLLDKRCGGNWVCEHKRELSHDIAWTAGLTIVGIGAWHAGLQIAGVVSRGSGVGGGAGILKTVTDQTTGNGSGGSGELSPDMVRLAEQHITNSGDTVLGRFPGYIDKAIERGASYFDVGQAWDALSATERTNLNNRFLDVIAERGDRILLSIPAGELARDTQLYHEIEYLVSEKGYVWVNQWSLRPGGGS